MLTQSLVLQWMDGNNFLWASPSSQGLPEHSYFGHRNGFWRSNSISVQLRIRKQKELINKRSEIQQGLEIPGFLVPEKNLAAQNRAS